MLDIIFHYIHTVNYTGNWYPSIQNDQNQNQNQNQNGLGTSSRTEPNIREKNQIILTRTEVWGLQQGYKTSYQSSLSQLN